MIPIPCKRHAAVAAIVSLTSLFVLQTASAREGLELNFERRTQNVRQESLENVDDPGTAAYDAQHVNVMRDIPYGSDPAQRFDVYSPVRDEQKLAPTAPVIFMVHGGGWRIGDKAMRSVVENKVKRWVGRGFIIVSINYRMLPKAAPLEQAQDVVRALAAAQEKAASWGGDRGKFILMGHSAGAHLVALISASPSQSASAAVTPWLGTIALDSAALDVVRIMEEPHARLYDNAFGNVSSYWRLASPFHAMTKGMQPFLAVCSTRRETSCEHADGFIAKAVSLGTRASVLRENLSHRDINQRLGDNDAYTRSVEDFMRTLDPVVARMMTGA
jgi:arylformamidase